VLTQRGPVRTVRRRQAAPPCDADRWAGAHRRRARRHQRPPLDRQGRDPRRSRV